MQPDFSKPAFAFAALCDVRFRSRDEGGHAGPFHSDYRCQLRYVEEQVDVDVRIYLIGCESVPAGDESPSVLAFLDCEPERERCRAGMKFELREGGIVTGTGIIHAVATR
jgi:translation elongation factor EF-Tu-like GTPase